MEYLSVFGPLDSLNTVYTTHLKAKNVKLNSATTTFLYFWNKTANHNQYEYYLYKNSAYPSKFNPVPCSPKKVKNQPSVPPPSSCNDYLIQIKNQPSIRIANENWTQKRDWYENLTTTKNTNTSQIKQNNSIKITNLYPRTPTSNSLSNSSTTFTERKRTMNPFASKKPLSCKYNIKW